MAETTPLLDEEQPAAAEESKKSDEYVEWSTSSKAFQEAFFHTGLYIFLGIVFYSFILDTKLGILESVYFSMSIFLTVGYGDISPGTSNAGMVFTVFFAVYGIIIIGIFLGVAGDYAVGRLQNRYEQIEGAARNKYLKTIDAKAAGDEAVEVEYEDDYDTKDPIYKCLNRFDPFLADLFVIAKDQQFLMYTIFILGIPIGWKEGWSIFEGFYWLTITGTTIGFGDLTPQSEFSKIYCIVYIPVTVFLVGYFLGNVADLYVEKRNDGAEEKFLNKALTESSLETMDTDNDNKVTKIEFLTYMLKTLGKVDQSELDYILSIFEKLDKDGSGTLTKEDISIISEETSKLHAKVAEKKS
jgi:hypothetical protein